MRSHTINLRYLSPAETTSLYEINPLNVTVGIITQQIIIPKKDDFIRIFWPQKETIKSIWIKKGGFSISESKDRYAAVGDDQNFFAERFAEAFKLDSRLVVSYRGTLEALTPKGLRKFRDELDFDPSHEGLVLDQFEVIRDNYEKYGFSPKLSREDALKDRLLGFSPTHDPSRNRKP